MNNGHWYVLEPSITWKIGWGVRWTYHAADGYIYNVVHYWSDQSWFVNRKLSGDGDETLKHSTIPSNIVFA